MDSSNLYLDKIQQLVIIKVKLFELMRVHSTAIYISCFLKYNTAFNVLKKMGIHAFRRKHRLFLHFAFSTQRYKCCSGLGASSSGFCRLFLTVCRSERILKNAWFFPVLMNRPGCHNKLLSSRTDFERKKANSQNVNDSWAFHLTIGGDQYHLFKWPCITPAIILSTFMSDWHFPRNFSTGRAATM